MYIQHYRLVHLKLHTAQQQQQQQQIMQIGQTLICAGNLLPSQSCNGRLISSASLGEHRVMSGQGLPTAGSSSALGSVTSTSSSLDSAQELSEKVWGVLLEGLQPFMQWELQSGMGDFWEQVGFLFLTSAAAVCSSHNVSQQVICMCLSVHMCMLLYVYYALVSTWAAACSNDTDTHTLMHNVLTALVLASRLLFQAMQLFQLGFCIVGEPNKAAADLSCFVGLHHLVRRLQLLYQTGPS